MFDQLMDGFRRLSESSLRLQQEMWRNLTQQVFPIPPGTTEWARDFQKRWVEMAVETLNKHREALDNAYKAGIQALEESLRVSEARSPEDYRRTAEDLWRKLFETFRAQYETQLQELQKFTTMSFDMAQPQAHA
jgi:undecaprenyl pyrophosphate synthase